MNKFIISGFADEIDDKVDLQFKTLNELGISYFEPRGIDGKNISTLTEDEMVSLKEKMDKMGIKASSIGSPIGKMKIEDDFDKELEKFHNVIKVAKTLESKYIRMFSFYCGGENEKYRDKVMAYLKEYVKIAEKEGIILLHENEKDIYGDIPERIVDIFENVKSDNLKAVFDPANFVQCGVDTLKAFDMLKEHIEYMHIKDALSTDGSVVPAGYGNGNVKEIISSLDKMGWSGFLSLEPHLGTFGQLKQLELDDKMLSLERKSDSSTFAIAHSALLKIINNKE